MSRLNCHKVGSMARSRCYIGLNGSGPKVLYKSTARAEGYECTNSCAILCNYRGFLRWEAELRVKKSEKIATHATRLVQ